MARFPLRSIVAFALVAVVVLTAIVWAWRLVQPAPRAADVTTSSATSTQPRTIAAPNPRELVIGYSVEERPIEAYMFGDGARHLLFVGGIHGGYEWNSILLAWQVIDYLRADPARVPDSLTVTIIPALNPDGAFDVIGKEGRFTAADVPARMPEPPFGRFNRNEVDLNRNFACNWQATSTWRGQPVSAGSAPFSEPEAAALRDFVQSYTPDAAVFWHSKAGAVFGSSCNGEPLPATIALMDVYAQQAEYRAIPTFDAYEVTGDAEGWLASLGIPAVTVELETRTDIEWARNRAAFDAVLAEYARTDLAR